MFNPLYPFTRDVLEATVKRGGLWFVRNTFEQASNPADQNMTGCYLLSHYNDQAKAVAHFNSIGNDAHRHLYGWEIAKDKQLLEKAAMQPVGFRIYSAYFYPDYKKRMSSDYKAKINKYMYRHTSWKPSGSDTIHIDIYLQFGILYLHLKYEGEELKIKFADIESHT